MRIDLYLAQNGYASSRQFAKRLIEEGRVFAGKKLIKKPSENYDESSEIKIIESAGSEFVSRGGYKLEYALVHFKIDVSGLVAADIGASTGGFTDCLLQRGAKRVYALDCGKNQLHKKLLCDSRVISIEKFNAKNLSCDSLPEKADIAVMDLSFISQTKVLQNIKNILTPDGKLVSLIKPQFEAGKENIGKNGIVKSEKARKNAVGNVLACAAECGFESFGVVCSPITGGDGNIEYLAAFSLKKL